MAAYDSAARAAKPVRVGCATRQVGNDEQGEGSAGFESVKNASLALQGVFDYCPASSSFSMTQRTLEFPAIITRSIVCIAILGVAGTLFVALFLTRPQVEHVPHGVQRPRVPVMRAFPVEVKRQWSGFGTAAAIDRADVPARVSSTVVTLPPNIQVGTRVNQGDLLAQLDESDFLRQVEIADASINELQAQLAQLDVEETSWAERARLAREEVAVARREFERVRAAAAAEAAKEREVDLARSALMIVERATVAIEEEVSKVAPRRARMEALLAQQTANRLIAQTNVERCRITSPITGHLAAVDIKQGENLAPGQRVARVVSLARIEIPLQLPARARARVGVGDAVRLNSSGEGTGWSGVVSRIAPIDDQAARTMAVYVEVEQDDTVFLDAADVGKRPLIPGKFVQGMVESRTAERRFVVPRRAVDGQNVLIVDDGVVRAEAVEIAYYLEQRFTQLGVDDTQWAVLANDLTEGALIVLTAGRGVVPGSLAEAVLPNGDSIARSAP